MRNDSNVKAFFKGPRSWRDVVPTKSRRDERITGTPGRPELPVLPITPREAAKATAKQNRGLPAVLACDADVRRALCLFDLSLHRARRHISVSFHVPATLDAVRHIIARIEWWREHNADVPTSKDTAIVRNALSRMHTLARQLEDFLVSNNTTSLPTDYADDET